MQSHDTQLIMVKVLHQNMPGGTEENHEKPAIKANFWAGV
jgi:hypothetical protein